MRGVQTLNVVQPTDRLHDARQIRGDDRIAVIGIIYLCSQLVAIDLNAKRPLEGLRRAFHIHDQPVRKTLRNRQAIAGRPIDHRLLILGRGREAGVPLFGRQVLVEVSGFFVLQLLQECFLFRHIRRSQPQDNVQVGCTIIRANEFGRAV